MGRNVNLVLIMSIGLCSGLFADTIKPDPADSGTICGRDIRMHDVLVLNLEPMRRDPDFAQNYVEERVGEFRLVNSDIEEIRTRSRPSKDPHGVVRRAQKLGVKWGCDLVLVLRTGPYLGRQRNWRSPRIKDQGYALVVMGERTASR